MAQLSREQLEQLRQKGLRPKTEEDELKEALRSPLEQLEQQRDSLKATASQIQGTYAEKWFNVLLQFVFKLSEEIDVMRSEQEIEADSIIVFKAAQALTEAARIREQQYKDYVKEDAPIPETLLAGIDLISEEIDKKNQAEKPNGMSLEKIDGEGEVITPEELETLL